VTDRREGRWVYYTLNPEAITLVEEALGAMRPRQHPVPDRVSAMRGVFFARVHQDFLITREGSGVMPTLIFGTLRQ
jgi:DNA-binding transcriptional ArsR family regulator